MTARDPSSINFIVTGTMILRDWRVSMGIWLFMLNLGPFSTLPLPSTCSFRFNCSNWLRTANVPFLSSPLVNTVKVSLGLVWEFSCLLWDTRDNKDVPHTPHLKFDDKSLIILFSGKKLKDLLSVRSLTVSWSIQFSAFSISTWNWLNSRVVLQFLKFFVDHFYHRESGRQLRERALVESLVSHDTYVFHTSRHGVSGGSWFWSNLTLYSKCFKWP